MVLKCLSFCLEMYVVLYGDQIKMAAGVVTVRTGWQMRAMT